MLKAHCNLTAQGAISDTLDEANGLPLPCQRLLTTLVLALMLTGCALPPMQERQESRSFSPVQTRETTLGNAIMPLVERHDGLSGVHLMNNPFDAFVARALLARHAEASLDVQYYIWQPDITGTLLLQALHKAAERGVRVRMLLDDNGINGMDELLAAMNLHPNVEIRLFNPFVVRSPKWIGYLTDFGRLNHRMHNKSFTADNQATIIGGRNIADAYFGAGEGAMFADLDALTVGPAANLVSTDFDHYWASSFAWPAAQILPEAPENAASWLQDRFELNRDSEAASDYVRALEESTLLQKLTARELEFTWAPVSMVSDDPSKVLGEESQEALMSQQLKAALDDPRQRVTLVSPYFIPRDAGVELFRNLEEKGVEVHILTNSLEANDVAMVHAGYSKYRDPLLEAGVQLYEMRGLDVVRKKGGRFQAGLMGSSASSLHAKTFAVDGKTLFIGSFNFDPRSVNINTELGFVIESPALAQQLETAFAERIRESAYELFLNDEGELRWREYSAENPIVHEKEPGTGAIKRSMVFFFSLLPIETLL
ncbi:phospholipase D family protein [Motiliproteus sp. SC1-56]|uniref:phospholipase D family protein n=1 Tax=Motiliproteus sp. SC1-56 TaxID=2799565 RepID=UPI001F5C4041|nr:phospholipase D family protein [Motiliproteus sp. SC1-56]